MYVQTNEKMQRGFFKIESSFKKTEIMHLEFVHLLIEESSEFLGLSVTEIDDRLNLGVNKNNKSYAAIVIRKMLGLYKNQRNYED